jgi:polysaccharide export outer membrane protein
MARPQEKPDQPAPPPGVPAKTAQRARDLAGRPIFDTEKKAIAAIEKMFAEYDLTPPVLPPIPENPPPHEGAMITLPIVVEPPDLLLVEVLEALPGRPVSGERLIRPDGSVSLGFYGDVQVKGLRLDQIKVAIIKHLRKYLNEDALGLVEPLDAPKSEAPAQPRLPEVPKRGGNPLAKQPVDEGADAWAVIAPNESLTVLIDLTSYNSRRYCVLGDVAVTGQLPWTGSETVLDAINYAGGLIPTADPKDIRLVRPGRNGGRPRVYKVDLEAIQARGEVAANYQILPGDRLIVGRNDVVKKTVELDRLNAPLQTVTGSMLQYASMLRALQLASRDNRDELLKELVDFWSKGISGKGDLKFDEQTLRDALIRKMRMPLGPDPGPAPR